jgi:predicted RecA/RadA family phage recombinase
MKNYVQDGDVIALIAPYAVNSGGGALVGTIFGVAISDVANGASGQFQRDGVVDITALTTDVIAQGAKVYWDNTNKRITGTVGSNTLVGAALVAKANGETTCRVMLDGAIR